MPHLIPCKEGTLRVTLRADDLHHIDTAELILTHYKAMGAHMTRERLQTEILRSLRREIAAGELIVLFG